MRRLFGKSRIIKTGVAVLLTAWICELFDWPPVFAVITAIVTIEPTVSDSIKKGIVRFPASAIGSAYAVAFISLFGNSPITYTLAAVFTIATCYKLNLHAGLLVATLTSVAMIEVIHDHFFIAFLIRLGTTTIGLVVSTMVNMFVLPPNYVDNITQNIEKIKSLTAISIDQIFIDILNDNPELNSSNMFLEKLENKIDTTSKLIQFQKVEAKYQPFVASRTETFKQFENQLKVLKTMHDKLEFLFYYSFNDVNWNQNQLVVIHTAIQDLAKSLQDKSSFHIKKHHAQKRNIINIFLVDGARVEKNVHKQPSSLPSHIVLLYELLAFYDLVEKFYKTSEEISFHEEQSMKQST